MPKNVIFENICLIGLGLIGSSLAHAIKKYNIANSVNGYARTSKTRLKAKELGLIDQVYDNIEDAVKNADLTIICTPVGVIGDIAKSIIPYMKKGSILSDVGSVKKAVIRDISQHITNESGIELIPCHPIAGTEDTGPEAGFATLFKNRWCILTPLENTDKQKFDKVKNLWLRCGSYIEVMDADHHDIVLAITSHIPHLIAYNIVGTVDDLENVSKKEVIKFSASGFRDFTRIASSDPTMWRDIFLNNKEAVLEMLGRFSEDLTSLQRSIRDGNGDKLFDLFTRTRAIRRSIIEAGQDVDEANFGRLHD